MNLDDHIREIVKQVVRELLADQRATPDDMLSPVDAAAVAKVKPGTIRRWIKQGRLRAQHAGRAVRVKRSDLEKFLRSGGRPANDLTPEQLAARDFG